MTLSIIGAGLGRTGTSSLKSALIELGHPCYHMSEIAFNPARREDMEFWMSVPFGDGARGAGWAGLFADYGAVVDFPACAFWRELMQVYPDAKLILSLHPKGSETWYDSVRQTVYANTSAAGASESGKRFAEMMDRVVWTGFFEGRFEDRDWAIARYEAHNQEVRDTVPADRFLEFSAAEGWAPLCTFLGVDVPDTPFPFKNTREEAGRLVSRLERMQAFKQKKDSAAG